MEKIVKILLLEDNLNDVELIKYQIKKNTINYKVLHVSDFDDFNTAIDEYVPDIILSDYNLIGFTGLDALELVKEKSKLTPFIIVTGTIDEETAAETIKKGAWDYIVKERLTRLDSAMKNALKLKEEKERSASHRMNLKISEERYKLAIEGSLDGIWDLDLKTNKFYFSTRWKSMLGYENHEIDNEFESWTELLHPDDKESTLSALKKHLNSLTPSYQVETRIKCKDGSYKWVFDRGKAIFDQHNQAYRIAGSQTDISERKMMEEKLIEAKEKAEESDRLKTAFLQNISHEIRTPLNGIVGFSKLLDKPNIKPEKRKKYIEIIKQSSSQLISIISDIISIATIDSGQEKINEGNVSIKNVFNKLKELYLLKSPSGIIDTKFICNLSDENSMIRTDETKLIQILTNLIDNAFKFTKQGHIKILAYAKNDQIEFKVKDTGIGISEDLHKKIFKRFVQAENTETRAYGGSGLGLSISKAYIELLGGQIWLYSSPEQGSEFYFTIPNKKANNSSIEKIKPLINSENSNSNSLLVVDDEPYNILLIEELLEDLNIKIFSAKDGKEAVNLCHKHRDINLVLMDIKMPVMDGKTATKIIKENRPKLPVIALTAYGLEQERIKFKEVGFDDYIKKPIEISLFNEILFKYLKTNSILS